MTAPAITVNLSATLSSTAGTVAIGDILVPIAGLYYKATTANVATAGVRAQGVALTAWSSNVVPGSVQLQTVGVVDASVTGLGVGAASWVRVSSAGRFERVTPSGSDDVCGWASTDGTVYALFGLLTAAIVNGGSGSFTPPTGTGFVTVTAGVLDVAALAQPLAVAKGGTGIAAIAAGMATFWATPSGANLAAALTSALPVSKGGTGLVALTIPASALLVGTTDTQVLTGKTLVAASNTITDTSSAQGDLLVHNGTRFVRLALGGSGLFLKSDGTTATWAAGGGGAASAGGAGQVQTSDGAGGFVAPTNVLAGANYISVGATPAASGAVRFPNGAAPLIAIRDNTNATDWNVVKATGAAALAFGDLNQDAQYAGFSIQLNAAGGSNIDTSVGSSYAMFLDGSTSRWASPNIGDTRASSPYGVHGESTTNMNNASITAAPTDYAYGVVKVTSTPTSFTTNRTLTMPAPASDAQAYVKFYRNAQAGAFNLVISSGVGSPIAIAVGKGAWIGIDSAGPFRLTADT